MHSHFSIMHLQKGTIAFGHVWPYHWYHISFLSPRLIGITTPLANKKICNLRLITFRFKSTNASFVSRLSRNARGRSPSQRRSLERGGSVSAPHSATGSSSFFNSGGAKKPLQATMSDRQSSASNDYLTHKASVAVHHTHSLTTCSKDDQASSLPSTPAEWLGKYTRVLPFMGTWPIFQLDSFLIHAKSGGWWGTISHAGTNAKRLAYAWLLQEKSYATFDDMRAFFAIALCAVAQRHMPEDYALMMAPLYQWCINMRTNGARRHSSILPANVSMCHRGQAKDDFGGYTGTYIRT